jgi:hypothetical protein
LSLYDNNYTGLVDPFGDYGNEGLLIRLSCEGVDFGGMYL